MAKTAPVVNLNPNLAGKEWGECEGQPLVEVRLPLLPESEDSMKPDQVYRYHFETKRSGKKTEYTIQRGRKALVPRDHFLMIRVNEPEVM